MVVENPTKNLIQEDNHMPRISKLSVGCLMAITFAIIALTGNVTNANPPLSVKPGQASEELKQAVSKVADELTALAGELKSADSGKTAANAMNSHFETIKTLFAKIKEADPSILSSEEKAKQALGEELCKKFAQA